LTEQRECSAVTSPDQWALGAGADKVTAVNTPDDDATSFIVDSNVDEVEQYSLTASAIPAGSTINSVTVYSRQQSFGSGLIRQGLALGLNTSETGDISFGNPYSTASNALTRPGGGAWSQADMASLEVYVKCRTSATNCRVTTLSVVIDYTPPAAAAAGDMLLVF